MVERTARRHLVVERTVLGQITDRLARLDSLGRQIATRDCHLATGWGEVPGQQFHRLSIYRLHWVPKGHKSVHGRLRKSHRGAPQRLHSTCTGFLPESSAGGYPSTSRFSRFDVSEFTAASEDIASLRPFHHTKTNIMAISRLASTGSSLGRHRFFDGENSKEKSESRMALDSSFPLPNNPAILQQIAASPSSTHFSKGTPNKGSQTGTPNSKRTPKWPQTGRPQTGTPNDLSLPFLKGDTQ